MAGGGSTRFAKASSPLNKKIISLQVFRGGCGFVSALKAFEPRLRRGGTRQADGEVRSFIIKGEKMKKKRFTIINTIYIATTLADLGITYYVSPDLSMEDNFAVKALGFGWGALWLIAILSITFTVFITYYDCFRYKTVFIKNCKYTEYYSLICFDRPDRFWSGLVPKHIKPEIAAAGFSLPWTMSFYRLWCICEWLIIYLNMEKNFPYSIFRAEYLAETLSVILALMLYYIWFFIEYKSSLKSKTDAIYRI